MYRQGRIDGSTFVPALFFKAADITGMVPVGTGVAVPPVPGVGTGGVSVAVGVTTGVLVGATVVLVGSMGVFVGVGIGVFVGSGVGVGELPVPGVGAGPLALPVTSTLSKSTGLFATKPIAPLEKVESLALSTLAPSTATVMALPLTVTLTVCQLEPVKLSGVDVSVVLAPFTTFERARVFPPLYTTS